MDDESAFLHCIRETPDDDVPRLVYADWLEENGRPERAGFIREQVELALLEKEQENEKVWCLRRHALKTFNKHHREWFGDTWFGRYTCERGFPCAMKIGNVRRKSADRMRLLFEQQPITRLQCSSEQSNTNASALIRSFSESTRTAVKTMQFYGLHWSRAMDILEQFPSVTGFSVDNARILSNSTPKISSIKDVLLSDVSMFSRQQFDPENSWWFIDHLLQQFPRLQSLRICEWFPEFRFDRVDRLVPDHIRERCEARVQRHRRGGQGTGWCTFHLHPYDNNEFAFAV